MTPASLTEIASQARIATLTNQGGNEYPDVLPTPFILKAIRFYFNTTGRLWPSGVARQAYQLFTSPRRKPWPKAQEAFITTAHATQKLEVAGEQVQTYTWHGQPGRPRLLMLHGWESKAATYLTFIPWLQEKGFEVVALDAPAHGRSTGKHTQLLLHAQALYAAYQQLGPFQAVFGHSMGGAAAMINVVLHKDFRPQHVVAIAAPTHMQGVIQRMAKGLALTQGTQKKVWQLLHQTFGEGLNDFHFTNRIQPLDQVNLLLVHDTQDHTVPFAEAWHLHQALPNSHMLATEGFGHRKIIKDTQVLQQIMNHLAL